MGATLTGAAFVLPSFMMVMGLAAVYLHYRQLAWIQGVFYGVYRSQARMAAYEADVNP
jgi:chromate transporter